MNKRSPWLAALTRDDKLELSAVAIGVIVGTWARSVRYFVDPISLWLDEASWAVKLLENPLLRDPIRPLGFFGLTRMLAQAFGPYEQVLRFLPWLSGVLSLPIAYLCARLLFNGRWVRVLVVWSFALHPLLIDFSKEFKPYSVEVLCHLLVIATTLTALQSSSPSKLVLGLALLAPLVAFPFAYNVLLTYPAVFGMLLWHAWRYHNRRHLVWTVAAALTGMALAFGLWWLISVHVKDKRYVASYWGHRYDVFLTEGRRWEKGIQPKTATRWVVGKYAEVAGGPAFVSSGWQDATPSATKQELSELYRLLWQACVVVGAIVLFRRDRRASILLLGPLLGIGVLNALGKWPLGFFRVNLFTLAYTTLLGGAALNRLTELVAAKVSPESHLRPQAARLIVGVLFLAPRLSFAAPAVSVKETRLWMGHSEQRTAIEMLLQKDPGSERLPLFMDFYSHHALPFYERFHPHLGQRALKRRYRIREESTVKRMAAALRKTKGPVWVMISRHDYVEEARKVLAKDCQRVDEIDLGRHHLLARCDSR